MNPFSKKTYSLLCKVPEGKVTTYKELARAAGKPRAARAVGMIMRANPNAPHLPCHRVVRSGGSIGGYAGGVKKKLALLKKEGISVNAGKVAGFQDKLYKF